MVSSILIILFSAALFAYWFRYSCLLILKTRTTTDYAADVATANQLSFLEVQDRLQVEIEAGHLDALRDSLSADYRLLTYLLRHASSLQTGGLDIEQRMLMIDFKIMQTWYWIARRFAVPQAHAALGEMAGVLSHFANSMGERSASQA